jgi:HK97 gp10 family phage protein
MVTVEVIGKITKAVMAAIYRAVAKAAYDMEAYAVRICPVDTGALRASIRVAVDGLHVVITAAKEYAMFVEFGTIKQRAQPYMRPAVYQWLSVFFPKRLQEELNIALRQV